MGAQAIRKIHPHTVAELAISSSVMRLMGEGELPVETYARYKHDIGLWYQECEAHGLSADDIKILEPHLLPMSGVADSQESIMLIVMDKHISNFSMEEANKLRKTIAKKKFKDIATMHELFLTKGKECGASDALLNYVWDVQVSRQLG